MIQMTIIIPLRIQLIDTQCIFLFSGLFLSRLSFRLLKYCVTHLNIIQIIDSDALIDKYIIIEQINYNKQQ